MLYPCPVSAVSVSIRVLYSGEEQMKRMTGSDHHTVMIAKQVRVWLLLLFLGLPADGAGQGKVYTTADGIRFKVETVLTGLDVPWSIVFDKTGNMYFTERAGRLNVLRKGERKPLLISDVEDVVSQGEGGLMGLALHPDFESNHLLYVSHTYRLKDGLANKVVRFRLENWGLKDRKVIVNYLPGSPVHNGCRLRFGPDGKLYVTTGDAARRAIAQDPVQLGGKILRLNDDGSIPGDNPDPSSPVYALGVRNPQGIDWDPVSGVLVETEHGPSGFDGPGGGDEVNLIQKGGNYGWPLVHHRDRKEGYSSPILEYTPAVAPASGVFYDGSGFKQMKGNFLFGCLRGTRIQRVVFDSSDRRKVKTEEALLMGEYGRIREVAVGPEGDIYFSTSNTSRGRPTSDDDRIMKMVPLR